MLAAAFGVVAGLANVVGGWLAVGRQGWDRVRQSYFVAAGAGFMLAAVFLRMVPESYRLIAARGGAVAPGGRHERRVAGNRHGRRRGHDLLLVGARRLRAPALGRSGALRRGFRPDPSRERGEGDRDGPRRLWRSAFVLYLGVDSREPGVVIDFTGSD